MLNEEVCHHNFVLFHQILSFSLKLISPVGSEVNPVSCIIIRPVFCVLPIKKPQEIVMCRPEVLEPSLHTAPRLRPVGGMASVLMHPRQLPEPPFSPLNWLPCFGFITFLFLLLVVSRT